MESQPQKVSGEGNKKQDEVWTEKKQKEHPIFFPHSQPPPTKQENKAKQNFLVKKLLLATIFSFAVYKIE